MRLIRGWARRPTFTIQEARVERGSSTPIRFKATSWRYSGIPSTNFWVATWARSAGEAMLFGIG